MLIIDSKKYPKPRSRHHNASNVYFALSSLEKTPRFYPPLIENIDWSSMYNNGKNPSILDIGCGWGNLLLQYAHTNTDQNILGLEVRKLPVDWINEVIKGEQITNAHSLWYSLPNGLPFIENDSIDTIFSFFPDPWIKKKHYKRRAFTEILLNELIRCARTNATLWQMTDVPEVAQYQIDLLQKSSYITLDSYEFIGDWTNDWDAVFPEGLRFLSPAKTECLWDLPYTDQEIFSQKKSIPYLRTKYRIT